MWEAVDTTNCPILGDRKLLLHSFLQASLLPLLSLIAGTSFKKPFHLLHFVWNAPPANCHQQFRLNISIHYYFQILADRE